MAQVRPPPKSFPRLLLVLLLAAAWLAGSSTAWADSYDDRRVRTGVRLFRALLAADTALEQKLDPQGRVLVWVYGADPRLAGEVAALIAPPGDAARALVRKLPLQVETLTTLPATAPQRRPVGLFLASAPADADLAVLVRWSIDAGVILYSPFEGHVERGATAGLAIGAKVQPYLNERSMAATGIVLKPFFLKVAKVHR